MPAHPVAGGLLLLADGSLLAAREVEVLQAVWMGLSNQEIADALALSVSSVRHYLQGVRATLGLSRSRMAVFFDRLAMDVAAVEGPADAGVSRASGRET